MEQLNAATLAVILGALGFGGIAVAIVNGFVQRKKLATEAAKLGADTTVVVIAAARELVDPLRAELRNERTDRAAEVSVHRDLVAGLRVELSDALATAHDLRVEVTRLREEVNALQRELLYLRRNPDRRTQGPIHPEGG